MNCHCGAKIPEERLDVLPDTRVCVKCSKEPKKLGVPAFGHKTGASVVVVDSRDTEGVRRLRNQYHRVRYRG